MHIPQEFKVLIDMSLSERLAYLENLVGKYPDILLATFVATDVTGKSTSLTSALRAKLLEELPKHPGLISIVNAQRVTFFSSDGAHDLEGRLYSDSVFAFMTGNPVNSHHKEMVRLDELMRAQLVRNKKTGKFVKMHKRSYGSLHPGNTKQSVFIVNELDRFHQTSVHMDDLEVVTALQTLAECSD